MNTLFINIWLMYAVTEGYEDAWYSNVNHWRAAIRRICTGLCTTVAYYHAEIFNGFSWQYISFGFFLAASFWLVFELSRNAAKHHPLQRLGDVASWDKFFKKYLGEYPTLILRSGLTIGSFYVHLNLQ